MDVNIQEKIRRKYKLQILQANGFTSRLQLKLLTREQIDVMFQNEISLGAKSLLRYKVDVLCDESPLQINKKKTTFERNEVEDPQPQAHKLSAHAQF